MAYIYIYIYYYVIYTCALESNVGRNTPMAKTFCPRVTRDNYYNMRAVNYRGRPTIYYIYILTEAQTYIYVFHSPPWVPRRRRRRWVRHSAFGKCCIMYVCIGTAAAKRWRKSLRRALLFRVRFQCRVIYYIGAYLYELAVHH
jgi:hypothetical protein